MPPAKPLFRWKTSGTADERSWDADESLDSHGLKELHPTRARARARISEKERDR